MATLRNVFFALTCLQHRYNGTEDESNMVIVEVNMLSGFYPDPDSLTSVSSHTAIAQTRNRIAECFQRNWMNRLFVSPQLMERKLVERYDDEDKSVLELYIEKVR